jgi:hypothetical protein
VLLVPRALALAFAVSVVGGARVHAQRPQITLSAGAMFYDAAGDSWYPSKNIEATIPVSNRVRVGLFGGTSNIGVLDTLSYIPAGPERYSRLTLLAEYDALPFGKPGAANQPALFFRSGFGLAHSSGHAAFRRTPGEPVPVRGRLTGLSATAGAGMRIPVLSHLALQGTLDFHYDEVLGGGLRNWTSGVGLVIRP